MLTTTTYHEIKAINFQPEDYEALDRAIALVRGTRLSFGDENVLMSLETGEVILRQELARVQNILEFLASYRLLAVNPQ